MRGRYIVFCAAAFAVACGPSKQDAATPPAAPALPQAAASTAPSASADGPAPARPAEAPTATTGGTKLRYFANVLDSDQPQKPSFELEAERLAMLEDEDNVWIVEKAHAVAYGEDGSETRFEAGEGRFDKNSQVTQLGGNVVCTMGTQRVEMQDVTWTNETNTASTQNPVVVSDGDTKLQAGSMEYNTESKTLRLPALSGTVSMNAKQSADDAAAGPGAFDFVDVTKGGLGEFVNGQLQKISGGVEIALRSADPAEKPMQLAAESIGFAWNDGERTSPKAIALEGGVSVDGPQGLVTADRADLDLAANTLKFAGKVRGKSGAIESFDAERIVYDMKSGDSEMSNLTARGISMGAPSGDAKPGAADFSSMNVERAGKVVTREGQVKTMTGGVAIALQPRDPAGKPLKLNAGEAVFAWSGDGGQPTAIAMRGDVRVDGPQGAIRAERGDFDLAKKQLVFSGKVNGSLPQLERFDSEKVTFNIETGEALMIDVTAKGLALGAAPKPDAPAPDGEKPKGYSRMDIETAPEVSITGQKLNWMRGGVSLIMHNADPAGPPLTVKAGELTFAYADAGTAPRSIVLKQDVAMNAPEMSVKSDQADLNMAANTIVFTGNVSGSTPQVRDFTATQLSYDMNTRQVATKGSRAARVSAKSQDEAKQP